MIVDHPAVMNTIVQKQLKNIPKEKVPVELEQTGNLVSASIPVVLEKMRIDGRLKPGIRTLLCGFGVGLSWGACLVTW